MDEHLALLVAAVEVQHGDAAHSRQLGFGDGSAHGEPEGTRLRYFEREVLACAVTIQVHVGLVRG
ncbi:hypothetical protein MFU01_74480 [Myxococcus fulvus]|uniref:Uncharacterized protein n=1 Tax=Myxococcus fulvus TaxID=33 RepID=A0A511TE20_MYXFU|nr:hypothetical protein [Myxococcus fulvus]GEN12411.1 hypothetical protein MFU01_74480 [Myxococcus fulvus]